MKKLVSLGAAAIGLVGLLGLGVPAASATPGPDQVAVCASVNTAINAQLTPTANANAAATTASANFSASTTAFNTALSAYGSTLTTWILDSDAHSANVNVDQVAFQNAASVLTTSISGWSGASVANMKATAALQVIELQNQVFSTLESDLSC